MAKPFRPAPIKPRSPLAGGPPLRPARPPQLVRPPAKAATKVTKVKVAAAPVRSLNSAPLQVVLLNTKDTVRGRYLLDCLRRGIQDCGDRATVVSTARQLSLIRTADAVAQVCAVQLAPRSSLRNVFRGHVHDAMANYQGRNLIVDTGFICNVADYTTRQLQHASGLPPFNSSDAKTFAATDHRIFYEVAWDGIKGGGRHCEPADPPADRWETLQWPVVPWRSSGRHILLLGQRRFGQSSHDVDVYQWYVDTIHAIRRHTDRPIILRQHPGVTRHNRDGPKETRAWKDLIPWSLGVTTSVGRTLGFDLQDAWAAVAYTTNAAVTAVVAGIPLFTQQKLCAAYAVADTDLSKLEAPTCPDRTPWLCRLSYWQWSAAEMRDGTVWRRYRTQLTEEAL